MLATHSDAAHLPEASDSIEAAVRALESRLPEREDCQVLVDFLEDDLREGLTALDEVGDHFDDVLQALQAGAHPITLVQAAEDFHVRERLEYLTVVVTQLRRRLLQAAGKLVSR